MNGPRKLPWDWYDGCVPETVALAPDAYVETSYSFRLCRAQRQNAIEYHRGAATYLGTMFDVGSNGHVSLGEFAMLHGARIICDSEIIISDYALISWNVVLMDTPRLSTSLPDRRHQLEAASRRTPRFIDSQIQARPIRIEKNVWIGFESCILPGVTIGEGSIIGARSVVAENVPPYTIVAGNPAQFVRSIPV